MDEFKYPDILAAVSIFEKLDIDTEKLNLDCQDWEYTLADKKYLEQYISLYTLGTTTKLEKRVLGSFIIQSLEDLLAEKQGFPQDYVLKQLDMLAIDIDIHKYEFEYWSLLDDKHYIEHEKDAWYITKFIKRFVTNR